MEREIKFRAWVETGHVKRMYPLGEVEPNSVIAKALPFKLGLTDRPAQDETHLPKIHLMQFLCHDKNGKELYEGDIVKRYYSPLGNDPSIYQYFYIGVIEFRLGNFGMVYKLDCGEQIAPERCRSHEKNTRKACFAPDTKREYFNTWLPFSHLEVIGNIYENPELIEP